MIAMDHVPRTRTPSQSGKPTALTAFHAPPGNLPQMAVTLGALIARRGDPVRPEVRVMFAPSGSTRRAEQSLALIAPRAGTTQDLMAQKPTSTLSTTARSVPRASIKLTQGRMLRAIAMDRVTPTNTPSQSDRRRMIRASIVLLGTFRHKARVPAPPARQGVQARQEVVVVQLAALMNGHPRVLRSAWRAMDA